MHCTGACGAGLNQTEAIYDHHTTQALFATLADRDSVRFFIDDMILLIVRVNGLTWKSSIPFKFYL